MPCADHGADSVQPKFVIDLLKEKVAAVEAALCIQRQIRSGMQGEIKRRRFLFFFLIHYPNLFQGPCLSVRDAISFADEFIGTESLDNKGLVFAIHPYRLHGAVCSRILIFCPSQSHLCHLKYIIQYL